MIIYVFVGKAKDFNPNNWIKIETNPTEVESVSSQKGI